MIPQPTPTPAAPAEVCERLKKEIAVEAKAAAIFGNSAALDTLTAALLLIEQGEKERERISKAFDLLLNAIPQKAVKHLDMGNLMAAVKLVPGCLILPDAARAQPTPESKSAQRGEEQP